MGRAGAYYQAGKFFDGQFAVELQYKPPTTILHFEDKPPEKPQGSNANSESNTRNRVEGGDLMPRAALRLSLIVIVALCLQPFGLAEDASPADETALRVLAEELFAVYAKEDVEGFVRLRRAKSPELATRQQATQELFAANEKIEVKSLTVSRVKVEGEKASLRLSIEVSAMEAKMGKPAEGFGRMNRALDLVKEEGRWEVWREAAAESTNLGVGPRSG